MLFAGCTIDEGGDGICERVAGTDNEEATSLAPFLQYILDWTTIFVLLAVRKSVENAQGCG